MLVNPAFARCDRLQHSLNFGSMIQRQHDKDQKRATQQLQLASWTAAVRALDPGVFAASQLADSPRFTLLSWM